MRVPLHSRYIAILAALFILLLLLLTSTTHFHRRPRSLVSHFSAVRLWWDGCSPQPSYPTPNMLHTVSVLQAWKKLITDDPNNVTATWIGPNPCNYRGIFCASPPDVGSGELFVAGIDLNGQNIAGSLPEELGKLTRLSLLHLNSNRFFGSLPASISSLTDLYELDISNNLFEGGFPAVVLSLPSLAYLDLRFNRFSGEMPEKLFIKPLDAIFLNNNKFSGVIPSTLHTSSASVIVLANNALTGRIPSDLSGLNTTLEELILLGNMLEACIPAQFSEVSQLTVLDLSLNKLIGPLPPSLGDLLSLEQLNVANNKLCGSVPAEICALPNLKNLTTSFNYFSGEGSNCPVPTGLSTMLAFDDTRNCIEQRMMQRSREECTAFLNGDENTCIAMRSRIPNLAPPPMPSQSPDPRGPMFLPPQEAPSYLPPSAFPVDSPPPGVYHDFASPSPYFVASIQLPPQLHPLSPDQRRPVFLAPQEP
ncbi:hypothetical protein KP509_15G053400 [Ceratopteris richardii]|uniref:Cell wall hydroxyproline-rich glycoprotein n=1 Tax=Ceratopteris richardii TaxID=49495 RepID=A0A8T2T9J7_CERRI|nr:hypothetical protein KP509_15G053400 [Ceratopteris richardii]KAH7405003.1 hypothetical protein KP509_15G053400 [Ceratopteris richardii]